MIDGDGSNQIQLTKTGQNGGPVLSPDGSRVVFLSLRDGQFYQIYVINTDGTHEARLTNSTASEMEAVWSPDGTRIAYRSLQDGQIHVMKVNGSDDRALTKNSFPCAQPAWSPDGTRIAFMGFPPDSTSGLGEIFVINSDGSNQNRLTFNNAWDFHYAWSGDSHRIVFASERDGARNIYLMDADGSNRPGSLTMAILQGDDDIPYGRRMGLVLLSHLTEMGVHKYIL